MVKRIRFWQSIDKVGENLDAGMALDDPRVNYSLTSKFFLRFMQFPPLISKKIVRYGGSWIMDVTNFSGCGSVEKAILSSFFSFMNPKRLLISTHGKTCRSLAQSNDAISTSLDVLRNSTSNDSGDQ